MLSEKMKKKIEEFSKKLEPGSGRKKLLASMKLPKRQNCFHYKEIKVNEDDYKTEIKDLISFYANILDNKYNEKIYKTIALFIYFVIDGNRRTELVGWNKEDTINLSLVDKSLIIESYFEEENFKLSLEEVKEIMRKCYKLTPKDISYKNFNVKDYE